MSSLSGSELTGAGPPPPTIAPERAARAARSGDAATVGAGEVAACAAVLLALCAFRVAVAGGPVLLNDSYQYLSAAEHLARDGSASSSIVHFDPERAMGRIPAPVVTFPPGYPLLIRVVSATGLSLEWAALAVSCLAMLSVLPLLRAAAGALGLSRGATRFALLAWTLGAQVSLWAVTLYSEAAFTAVSLAALVLLLSALRSRPAPAAPVIGAFLLAGIAVWIRYAGVFVLGALHLFAAARLVRRRDRRWPWLAAVAAADLAVLALVARNLSLTGSATGGHLASSVHHGLGSVLYRFGAAGYGLVLGSWERPTSAPFGPLAALLGGGIAAALAAGAVAVATRRETIARRDGWILLALCFALYNGALARLGATSNVSLDARMLLPIVPVAVLLLAGALWTAPARPGRSRTRAATLAAIAVGYGGTNVASLLGRPPESPHAVVAARLALPTPGGEPLARWIEAAIPRDGVVLAVDGQATGYVLRRPTISAVGRLFTSARWDEDEVRRTMARFGAEWLVVYPEAVASGGADGLDSPLFGDLAAGRTPPWLELAALNARARVYRRVALPAGAADVVIRNGRIWTGAPAMPWAEAIAVRGGRILRVGSAADVAPLVAPATRAVDLGGRLAIPGLIDAHTHPSLEAERPWHFETALPWSLVRRHERLAAVIRPTRAVRVRALATSLEVMSSFGITAFGDGKVEPRNLPVWASLLREHGLRQHAALFVPALDADGSVRHAAEIEDAFRRAAVPGVTLGAKLFVDGYLEHHTAALVEPYADGGGSGRLVAAPATLRALVDELDAAGLPIQAHAIGDGAVRAALDAFEEAHRRRGPAGGPRDVIVHLKLVHPDDVARFARLGVGAAPYAYWAQPAPANDFLVPLLGQARVDRSYLPLAPLWSAGALVGASSDWASVTMSPFHAMWVGVTRECPQHRERGALGPANAVALERMVRSYTVENAALLGIERDAGSLEPGKWADLAVLDRDIFARPLDELLRTRIERTIFEGEVVYDAAAGLPDAVVRTEAELLELGKAH